MAGEALTRAQGLFRPEAGEGTVRDGYLDLLASELPSTGPTQDLMLTRLVPSIYERWWRPALGRVFKGIGGPGMSEEIRIATRLLALRGGETVLDLACGPGNFSREFARAVGDAGLVVGVDASETMLARGAEELERSGVANLALLRAGATELPFGDGRFDAACCFAALHLFGEPFAALDEMRRVLCEGGRIAIMTSVRRPLIPPPLKPLLERSSGMRVFEAGEITAALRARGFIDVEQRVAGAVQFVGGRLPG